MNKEMSIFGDSRIEKHKYSVNPISVDDIGFEKISTSNKGFR